MTLSILISKYGLINHMTATSVTVATEELANINSVADVAIVAVATPITAANFKHQLTNFVEECCKGFSVNAQQVIDHLLSIEDELDIINGDISLDVLRLHIEVWIKSGMRHISGKML